MNSSVNKEHVVCSSCGRRYGVSTSYIEKEIQFRCLNQDCSKLLRLGRAENGEAKTTVIFSTVHGAAPVIRRQTESEEVSTVTPAAADIRPTSVANAAQPQKKSEPAVKLSDDSVNEIVGKVLARLLSELPATVSKILQRDPRTVGNPVPSDGGRMAANTIGEQTGTLISDVFRNVQEHVEQLRQDLVEELKNTGELISATWDDEMKSLNLGSDLRKRLSRISKDIGDGAKEETLRVIRKLKHGIRQVEGEQLAFRLPVMKRKENDSTPELTNAQLQEMGNLLARAALAPESVTRLVEDLGTLRAREHLIEDLPAIFDFLEMEFSVCEKNSEDESHSAVRKVLERLRLRMKAWMDRNGLQSFPEVGDSFDWKSQECIGTMAPDPDDNGADDRVAIVELKGYQFIDSELPLRRARVICFKARPKR